jgi:hypothetical protein
MTLSPTGRATKLSVHVAPEMAKAIDELAYEWDCTRADVLREGIALLTDPGHLAAHIAVSVLNGEMTLSAPRRTAGSPRLDAGLHSSSESAVRQEADYAVA